MDSTSIEHVLWVWALAAVYADKKSSHPKLPTSTTSLFKYNGYDVDALALHICQVKMFGLEITADDWDALCYCYLRRLRERCIKTVTPQSL